MEGGDKKRDGWWFIPVLALSLQFIHFSRVEPLDCTTQILPPHVNEVFSFRQHGFTLTCKSTLFQHDYWLLHFEAASFSRISLIQLWAWIPVAHHATELILEFKNGQRSSKKVVLDSFPITFSSYQSQEESLLDIYCLLTYWMEVVPAFLAEEKSLSTDVADANLYACASTKDERDVVLLLLSPFGEQPSLFHLPHIQEPFTPDEEQLILGQNHQQVDYGQAHFPAEKLCSLQDRKVNLHRAAWGKCIVAPKIFRFPYCKGTCLALDSELQHSHFECYTRESPTCSKLFQVCGPIKVRLLSLMIQDNEQTMSVHYVNTPLIEKCGCF